MTRFFILVLQAICKDVEVIGVDFKDITELILISSRVGVLWWEVNLVGLSP